MAIIKYNLFCLQIGFIHAFGFQKLWNGTVFYRNHYHYSVCAIDPFQGAFSRRWTCGATYPIVRFLNLKKLCRLISKKNLAIHYINRPNFAKGELDPLALYFHILLRNASYLSTHHLWLSEITHFVHQTR